MKNSSYFPWDNLSRGSAACVADDSTSLSYEEFAHRTDAAAALFAEKGVGRGDIIAAVVPNRLELLISLTAAWRLGAVATPVNPAFTADEAAYQFADSDASLVIGTDPGQVTGEVPFLHVDELPVSPPTGWAAPEPPSSDDVALLIYTSGSTGRPKGVQLTHGNLHYMGSAMAELTKLTQDDHALLILPLFHVNAICLSFLAPILAGGRLTVTGRFSVNRFFDDVERLRPTYFSAVPTIYALLAASDRAASADLSSVRFAICGAAPISRELFTRVSGTLGITILEGYGLTEGSCASACNPLDGPQKLGTVGPAIPGQTIRIVDPDGTEVPRGERGEVVISGPNVMHGYLGRPDATAETVVDGWLHTGDVGIMDEDGYLSIVDRMKDMIIRGGENLYPKEIESAISEHPAVSECAVVGAPDDLYGEVPVAWVTVFPDEDVTEEELAEHTAARLTKVKRPADLRIVEELPKNPVGKIDKPTLRRMCVPAESS